MKTWVDKEQLDRLKCKIKYAGLFVVHSQHRGGGLALPWQKRVSAWVDSFSKFHIDALINGGTNDRSDAGFQGCSGCLWFC